MLDLVRWRKRLASRLIHQLRERNFILCLLGGDYFGFVHRTLLEFFCAWAWVWKFEKGERDEKTGEWKRITLEELQKQTFETWWPDEKWHEVLRLIAARLEPLLAGQLIKGLLLHKDPSHQCLNQFLAARCFADVRNSATLPALRDQIRSLLTRLTRFSAFYELPVPVSVRNVRSKAVRIAASCWPKEQWTLVWLKNCARAADDPVVRIAAVEELEKGWRNDPSVQQWLIDRARSARAATAAGKSP